MYWSPGFAERCNVLIASKCSTCLLGYVKGLFPQDGLDTWHWYWSNTPVPLSISSSSTKPNHHHLQLILVFHCPTNKNQGTYSCSSKIMLCTKLFNNAQNWDACMLWFSNKSARMLWFLRTKVCICCDFRDTSAYVAIFATKVIVMIVICATTIMFLGICVNKLNHMFCSLPTGLAFHGFL